MNKNLKSSLKNLQNNNDMIFILSWLVLIIVDLI